jgi:putative FmdB family regulatory protein
MPTYEYVCRTCGQHIDVVQSFSEEPLTVCPNCGGELRKVFHPAGILLKGSGFYKTDNRPKTGTKSETGSSSSSSGDSKTTSDAKKSDTKESDAKKSDTKEKSA